MRVNALGQIQYGLRIRDICHVGILRDLVARRAITLVDGVDFQAQALEADR